MGNQQGKDPNLDRQGDTFGAGKKPHSGDNGQAPQDQPTNNSNNVNVGGGGIAKNAASKVTGAYNGVAGKVGKGIQKSANYVNVSIGDKATKVLSHVLIWSVLGGAGYGIYQYSQQNPLYSGNVCSTLNDNGDQYSDMNISGATGEWMTEGTQKYNIAKQMFEEAIRQGCSPAAAAGIVGQDGAIPSNYQEADFDPNAMESGGGNGVGFFQFSNDLRPKSFSMKDQVACILGNAQTISKEDYMKYTDPMKAGQDFCIYFERPQDARGPRADARGAGAVKALELFGKFAKDVQVDAGVADSNAASAEQANDANCNNQDDDQQTASGMAAVAQQLLGYFHYDLGGMSVAKSGSYQDISSISQVNKAGGTDCSGYVWLVMKLAGYNVPSDRFGTGLMESDAKGAHQYFKAVDPSNAKAGDVFIINKGSGSGPDGHTGVLLEDWHGNDTKIINEGGMGGGGPVNESTYYEACKDLVDGGGRLTLAQPVKK